MATSQCRSALVIAAAIVFILAASTNQRRRQLRHRFSQDPRSVTDKGLRYAAFGTSRTWGSGLADRETEAYVKVLSPSNGKNFGIPAGREDIPARCLASMIGDDDYVFDVIILEYVTWNHFRRLAKRLRAKFPHSLIIALEIMNLNMSIHKPTDLYLREYMKKYGYIDLRDPKFHQHLREETSREDWIATFTPDKELRYRDKIMGEVTGHVVRFPHIHRFSDPYDGDVREYIIMNSQYFGELNKADPMHPSLIGHQEIARRIQEFVLENRNYSILPTNPNDNKVGPWLFGKDRCITWYEDGDLENHDVHIERMTMTEWSNGNKHALEVDPMGGSLEFDSPMDGILLVTYMAMGPGFGHYPRVSITIESLDDGHRSPPVVIDPNSQHPDHIEIMSPVVGRVSRGKNRMQVWTTDSKTEHPFRITGISIAAADGDNDAALQI